MTLRQLRYFTTVAEELSFTQAARKLFISQPGLSATIRELENELGTTLFVRSHGSSQLALTEAGQIFLKYTTAGLACIDHGRDALSNYILQNKQALRIGYIHTIPISCLQQLFQEFQAKNGSVEISRNISTSNSELLSLLHANKLHFSFCLSLQAGIEGIPIFYQRLYVMVSRKHPWGNRTEITFDELKNAPCVRVRHAVEINQKIDDVYQFYHSKPMILSAEVGNQNAALIYVLDYNCYAVTPKLTTIDLSQLNALTIVGHPMKRPIYLAWKSGKKMTAKEREFLEFAQNTLGKNPVEI